MEAIYLVDVLAECSGRTRERFDLKFVCRKLIRLAVFVVEAYRRVGPTTEGEKDGSFGKPYAAKTLDLFSTSRERPRARATGTVCAIFLSFLVTWCHEVFF
mmetsp:Transcript_16222/g.40704  ORF Transcript_16222/g.40704 Transcript_16222/m.40704 type:complete len:101 (+) Transcript_16222:160-462(+)